MAEPRISQILIGLVLVGLIAVGMAGFFSDGAQKYSSSNDFDNDSLEGFTNLTSKLEAQVNQTSSSLDGVGTSSEGLFDVFGSFFASAWTAIKTTGASIGLFQNLISFSVASLPFGNSTFFAVLTSSLIMIVIIIIVIAILFHFIRQSSRL